MIAAAPVVELAAELLRIPTQYRQAGGVVAVPTFPPGNRAQ